jgi:leucyl-tRNA synthetase
METLDWNESLKAIQRNWIGRSEGAFIDFKVAGYDSLAVKVFTTRPDTIFGSTFMVLAPEHDLVKAITPGHDLAKVEAFLEGYRTRALEQKAGWE